MLFEVSVMRRCEMVTQIGWNIFSHLTAVQEKYDNTFIQLFQILNCYIYYGKDTFSQNPELLTTVSNMCGKCLFAIYKSKINEATNAEAALIFQQMFFTFRGQMDNLLPSIFAFVILKLTTPIKNNFFKARLIGVILAGFSYNFNLALQVLRTSNMPTGQSYFEYIFEEITKNSSIFKHPYDKKVAISGLTSFFSNPELVHTYSVVFQLIIEILSTNWKDLIPTKPILSMNEEGNMKELEESLKAFNSEEMEASLGLTTYLTPLDQFDDYDFFRDLIKSFQKQDLAILMKSLNKIQTDNLYKIMQTKRIPIGDNPGHTDARIKLKPKYKNKN